MNMSNALQWAVWSYLTKDYYYTIGMTAALFLISVEMMFFMWANRIIIKPLNDKSSIVLSILDRVMQILIAYFK